MNIDPSSQIPLYEQLYAQFVEYISLGVMKVGDKMPSVRMLSSQVHVNPNTVQKTYAMLEENGYVESIPGKGSYVCEKKIEVKQKVENEIIELLRSVHNKSQYVGLSFEQVCKLLEKEWGTKL